MARPIIEIHADIDSTLERVEAELEASRTRIEEAVDLAAVAASTADRREAAQLQADAAAANVQAAVHLSEANEILAEVERLMKELEAAEEGEEIAQALARPGENPAANGRVRLFKDRTKSRMEEFQRLRQQLIKAD